MRSFVRVGIVLSLLVALLALACSTETAASPTVTVAVPTATQGIEPTAASLFPVSVTDSNGNTVVFEKAPERIVAIDSAVLEILFAMGEGHRVVATHDFVVYPPEAADIERVGGAFSLNIEKVVELEPDLVFTFFTGPIEALENAGLKVLYIESLSNDFTKVADNIRLWGRIVGNPTAAEAVAAEFNQRVAGLNEKMEAIDAGPSIFWDVGGFWTSGPDTLVGEVFTLLKLNNVASDIEGYAQLSPEQIVEREPEVILALDASAFLGNPAFDDVAAVRNGRIVSLPFEPGDDPLSVASPRFVDGIEALARLVYPELFP
ncbi:MAG: ABC transporter substrate-binding protein [Chloroflexi bacterium]|nr:ABC transporter substrate-binding protein [Chloroflexota bacterium]